MLASLQSRLYLSICERGVRQMAKLGARGRTEVYRVEKEIALTEESKARGVIKTVLKRALMSDNKILENQVTWFTYEYHPSGQRRNDYGWVVKGTLKKEATPAQWLEQQLKNGYKLVE